MRGMRGSERGPAAIRLTILGLMALLLAPAAPAATRGFTVTSFDRIRLAGPYAVTVRVGPAVSARAEGDPQALDRVRLEVQDGTLSIRFDRTLGSGAEAPATVRIALTTPGLRGAAITGAGSLAIDRAAAQAIALSIAGAGTLNVDGIVTDRLALTLVGAGTAAIGGTAATARLVVQGDGRINAAKLVATDADVVLTGAGAVTLAAKRTAKVAVQGAGDVTVTGTPTCTIRNEGTGAIVCGAARR